ncbi:MAG: ABC transporter [Opitutia bacterium]|nr:ATP-binding cassette domain-containing protein [Opitutales bacterium]PHX79533.1 MAG: ABC transporter [Opitutae bacterium]
MLSCQNLTVQAGNDGPVILDGANARFLPRGLNAVIGPSGCGKTTLMKAILGILPSSGEAYLADQRITCTEDLVGKVGFAPQFTAAQAQLTVGESLAYALELAVPDAAERSRRLESVLGVTGLAPHRDKRVSALSGGQLRRLSLGLELTLDPPCMVCDEVTSGLDPQSEDQILALLRNLAETNHKSFVCIIHNLGKLNQFDWVTVVYQGDVVFQGSPADLLGYFGIPDGLRLYEVLNASDLATWRDRWAIHQAEYPDSFEVAVAQVGAPAVIEPLPEPDVPGGVSQFTTLLSRRLKLFFRDTGYLGLTLAITFGFPLLVIIFNLDGVWDVLKIPMDRNTSSMAEVQQALKVQMSNAQLAGLAAGLVMFQVILLTLMGANNGGREISAERILYEKERMTGLRPWAYAFSKIVFVSLVAIFQGFWMCFFVKLICNFPGPWAEQLAILAASCVSMSIVCLGFSAMLTSPEKSSLLSIYLVGFQLPLSGVVLALPAALTWVCRPFINSYWGWSGYMKSMMGHPLYDAYTASMPNQTATVASTTEGLAVLLVQGLFGFCLVVYGCQQKRWN